MEHIQTSSETAAIRLGVVGAGGIARTHAGAVAQADVGRVVAAADPNRDALTAFADATGAEAHESADAMLQAIASGSLEVDALVICSPPSFRRAVIGPALEQGLVEKPLAANLDEARALAELARQHSDRIAAIGYCHRFTPAVLEMRRLVESGSIGRLTRFENVFAFHDPSKASQWFSDPAVSGGGALMDAGCHSLDLFQFLVGVPKVAGMVGDQTWPGRGESASTPTGRLRGVQMDSGSTTTSTSVRVRAWRGPPGYSSRPVRRAPIASRSVHDCGSRGSRESARRQAASASSSRSAR